MGNKLIHVEYSRLIRGVDFGPIWGASGADGPLGDGFWFHHLWRVCTASQLYTKEGMTTVLKTTTFPPNKGNMPLKKDGLTPKEWFPECIAVNFFTRAVVNAVGLSGPGAEAVFNSKQAEIFFRKCIQKSQRFMISFMSTAETSEKRLEELREFVEFLKKILEKYPELRSLIAIQWNLSCPNVGLSPDILAKEAVLGLDVLAELGIPIIVKFNPLVPLGILVGLDKHQHLSGFCIGNTIPWSELPESIRLRYFGSTDSPIWRIFNPDPKDQEAVRRAKNAGALSGTDYNRILACNLIREMRKSGVQSHVNGCGGIRHWRHVDEYYWAGASSVSVGSLGMLAAWRYRSIIRRAYRMFSNISE